MHSVPAWPTRHRSDQPPPAAPVPTRGDAYQGDAPDDAALIHMTTDAVGAERAGAFARIYER